MNTRTTINVFQPEVEAGALGVYRGAHDGLVISLDGHGTRVVVFATDAEWDRIVEQVAAFRASEAGHSYEVCGPFCPDVPRGAIHDIDMPDDEMTRLTQWVNCAECHELDLAADQAPGGLCHNCAWRLAQDDRAHS